jgi:hypothetical protein
MRHCFHLNSLFGLLTDSTNDGSPTIILGRSIFGIELCKPLNSSSASVQMVESVRHVGNGLIGLEVSGVFGGAG